MMLDSDKHIYTVRLDDEGRAEALALIKDMEKQGYTGHGVTIQVHDDLLNISLDVAEG
jgi:hypothetical protein